MQDELGLPARHAAEHDIAVRQVQLGITADEVDAQHLVVGRAEELPELGAQLAL